MSAITGAKSKMLRKTPTRVVAMHQRNMSSSVPETARLHKDHGRSGIDAARGIHAQQALRCIFLSGNQDEATRFALLPCDTIAFVGKPVLPVVLKRALQKAEGLTDV